MILKKNIIDFIDFIDFIFFLVLPEQIWDCLDLSMLKSLIFSELLLMCD